MWKRYPTYLCETQPKCVAMYFNGTLTRREKSQPFMMFGNAPGPVRAGVPPIYGKEIRDGYYTLKACAFAHANCRTAPLGCEEVPVYVDDLCLNRIYFFEVTDPGQDVFQIVYSEPSKISLSDFTTYGKLNIEPFAENNTCGKPPIGCVKIAFGSVVRKETLSPYKLYRTSGTPALGTNKLSACTYTDIHCKYGRQGCHEIEVEVVA